LRRHVVFDSEKRRELQRNIMSKTSTISFT
jgi:hypothetical protein